MRKLFYSILFIGTLIACEKDEVEFLQKELLATEAELQAQIDDVKSALEIATASLNQAIADEARHRANGDIVLANNLQLATDRLSAAIEAGDEAVAARLSALLDAEVEARIAGDLANADALAEAVAQLSSALAAEEKARIAGDDGLAASLNSAIVTLNSAIDAEAQARIDGDAELQQKIKNLRRKLNRAIRDLEEADESLRILIEGHVMTLQDAIDTNSADIIAEANRVNALFRDAYIKINGITTRLNGLDSEDENLRGDIEALQNQLIDIVADINLNIDDIDKLEQWIYDNADRLDDLGDELADLEDLVNTLIPDPFEGKTITLATTPGGVEYLRTNGFEAGTRHNIVLYVNGEQGPAGGFNSIAQSYAVYTLNTDTFNDGDVLTFTISLYDGGAESEVLYTHIVDLPPMLSDVYEFAGSYTVGYNGIDHRAVSNPTVNWADYTDATSFGGFVREINYEFSTGYEVNPLNVIPGYIWYDIPTDVETVTVTATHDNFEGSVSATITNPRYEAPKLNLLDYLENNGSDTTHYGNGLITAYHNSYSTPPGFSVSTDFTSSLNAYGTGEASITVLHNGIQAHFNGDTTAQNVEVVVTHDDFDGQVIFTIENPIYATTADKIANAGYRMVRGDANGDPNYFADDKFILQDNRDGTYTLIGAGDFDNIDDALAASDINGADFKQSLWYWFVQASDEVLHTVFDAHGRYSENPNVDGFYETIWFDRAFNGGLTVPMRQTKDGVARDGEITITGFNSAAIDAIDALRADLQAQVQAELDAQYLGDATLTSAGGKGIVLIQNHGGGIYQYRYSHVDGNITVLITTLGGGRIRVSTTIPSGQTNQGIQYGDYDSLEAFLNSF